MVPALSGGESTNERNAYGWFFGRRNRDVCTRGFVVDVVRVAMDRWTTDATPRSIVPLAEFERYASRLKRIATAHDGTYVGYTPD